MSSPKICSDTANSLLKDRPPVSRNDLPQKVPVVGPLQAIKDGVQDAYNSFRNAATTWLGSKEDCKDDGDCKLDAVSMAHHGTSEVNVDQQSELDTTTKNDTKSRNVEYVRHIPNSIVAISGILLDHRPRILYKLISVINIRTINHENICCLNTALIILIVAHQR
jgi:hypothetical protein